MDSSTGAVESKNSSTRPKYEMEQLFRYSKIIKVIYNFLIDYDYSFVLMRESVELRCILINLTLWAITKRH